MEDVTHWIEKTPDIVITWGRNDARATTDAVAGKLTFSLINTSRMFSPENTSSPIAGKVLPGTPVRVNVTNPLNGATTTLFQGPIDTLDVDANATGKDVSISCLDGWGTPGATILSTPVYQGMRTGDLMNVILDQLNWPLANRSIDYGATLIPYWWVDGVDAVTAVNDLVHSEGPPAIAYVKGGIFFFRDRHHRLTSAVSTTSQGTYTHIQPAGTGPAGDFKILRGSFTYDHGLNNIVNTASLTVTPVVPQDFQYVWSVTDPITLAPGETRTIIATTTDPFIMAQVPDQTTGLLQDDGTLGFDYHALTGAVTITLSRTSGASVMITLVGDAALGVVMDTGLRMRGVPLTQGATYTFQSQDPSSVNTYGPNNWDGNAPWAYIYDADVISQRIVAAYAQARPAITLETVVFKPAYLTQFMNRQISDRITIRNDEMGLNADFMIEQVTHTIQQLGVKHTITLGCQSIDPQQPDNVFTFNTSGKGFDQGSFGVLGISNSNKMFTFDTAGKGFDDGVFAY